MRGFYARNESRVTFYNLKENTFDWKIQFQSKKTQPFGKKFIDFMARESNSS